MKHLPHQLVPRRISELQPYPRNARTHSRKQVRQIADSMERFGFTNPVLISTSGEIIAGHGRVEAAKMLGWTEVPTLELSHLSSEEKRAYILADNKLALNAGWDQDILSIELQALMDADLDLTLTGFSVAEIDITLDAARERKVEEQPHPEDLIPEVPAAAVSRFGDKWQLGRHRLLCGDARSRPMFEALLAGENAQVIFTDPPYNVPIDGHVSGLGKVRHREFAMASGEMSSKEFTQFLKLTLGNAASFCRNGAIAFVCMDWRHIAELAAAGEEVFTELKNVCVWNKSNGGMGSFYRSKHELVFVFKNGREPHINNFGLGETGRYRTNVWDYPGVSTFSSTRAEEQAMHPTVKPVALVADALRDCSRRGDIVLDPFAGSGSTLIAAESCGRTARLIEYDPGYCDVIISRFTVVTGRPAVLLETGECFEDVASGRTNERVR